MINDCLHRMSGSCDLSRPDNECVASCSANTPRVRVEVWTRVMGYHRPVSCFNEGKKAEHAERVQFLE